MKSKREEIVKFVRWIALIPMVACVTGVTGCVSPFYGTARIEKGLHIDAGIAGVSYVDGWMGRNPSYTGIRGDIELRYGVCKYLQGSARIGLGWGYGGGDYFGVAEHDFLHDAALGPQFALPITSKNGSQLTPGLRIEAGYANDEFYATPTVLLGFGNPESFTLGTRFLMYMPSQFLFTLHKKRLNLFAGIDIWTQLNPDFSDNLPVVTLGIGYKIK